MAQASTIQMIGAVVFGIVIGWYLYHLSRHRAGDIKLRDLITVIGAIGGGGVLALFPEGTDLFGAYGIGLGVGYFGYFLVLLIFVARSDNFSIDYFIDGRRRTLGEQEDRPVTPDPGAMGDTDVPGKSL